VSEIIMMAKVGRRKFEESLNHLVVGCMHVKERDFPCQFIRGRRK
jgi:hypothetical protein